MTFRVFNELEVIACHMDDDSYEWEETLFVNSTEDGSGDVLVGLGDLRYRVDAMDLKFAIDNALNNSGY